MTEEHRLDPDTILRSIRTEEARHHGGHLRIFFGMAAGVGKTYAMLKAAQQRRIEGIDVVVGIAETHGRPETEALLENLIIIPRKQISYHDSQFAEMDLDAILARRPQLALVDELAHTNIPGSRHTKRWQDVVELLDAGIDVYSPQEWAGNREAPGGQEGRPRRLTCTAGCGIFPREVEAHRAARSGRRVRSERREAPC